VKLKANLHGSLVHTVLSSTAVPPRRRAIGRNGLNGPRRHREDYARAGYRVLPWHATGATVIFWQAIVPLIVLMPLSLAPAVVAHAGLAYLSTAVTLAAWFVFRADQLAAEQSNATARRLLGTSIAYLALLFVVLLVDRM
jgi:protoheme IX farnesyltransferase